MSRGRMGIRGNLLCNEDVPVSFSRSHLDIHFDFPTKKLLGTMDLLRIIAIQFVLLEDLQDGA